MGVFINTSSPDLRSKAMGILYGNIGIRKLFSTKEDSNHFHIDAIIVSGRQYDVKMWNDVFINSSF